MESFGGWHLSVLKALKEMDTFDTMQCVGTLETRMKSDMLDMHSSLETQSVLPSQPCRYATGIDTGCVLGDQLTAVVLPPVRELRDRGVETAPRGSVTLASLGGSIISVKAQNVYNTDDKDQ
jgi:hypothetical protein